MLVVQETTPKAYRQVVSELSAEEPRGSRAGEMKEELGALVVSGDPRERYLDRDGSWNLAFQLQEHWAYWAGANPGHVERYNSAMEDWMVDGELPGSAYGDRLRNTAGHDQLERLERLMRESPGTRRAMAMVHQPAVEDYSGGDVACTAYLHPFARDGELHMVAALRSQDMYWGYAYDAANNQFIQEALAARLGLEPGHYWHFMDSCHYYTDFEDDVLDATSTAEPVSGPEVDVGGAAAWDRGFARLTAGLAAAREGDFAEGGARTVLGVLDDLGSDYFADWLKVMASYEAERYHDDPDAAAKLAGMVDDRGWRDWAADRAGGAP